MSCLPTHRGLSRAWWFCVWPRLAPWLYLPVPRGLWRMVVCTDPAQFLAHWCLPRPGVRCQGPPCCLRLLPYQGPSCWLVRSARALGLGRSSLRHDWHFPTHLWRSFTDVDVPPLSPAPSVASSPPASAFAATASVPAPTASAATASVPVSAPVGPAPVASNAAAADVPVTAGRVAAVSALLSAPLPRGKM
ncbi:hypothetical protein V6N13_083122 [Hibiscus sabdariffa]